MTRCSGLPCSIDDGKAVCIHKLCLCENSLLYNTSRGCEAGNISTPYPLRVCGPTYACDAGIPPLYESCVEARCVVTCDKDPDCRHVNAICLSGLCMCNYGMVMSVRGCPGLQYIRPYSQSRASTSSSNTPGFWLYAGAIGGVILVAAIILTVIHALLSVRPARLETLRRLTHYPNTRNPFAPERQPMTCYSKSRRTPITRMVEKRYNLKPIASAHSKNKLTCANNMTSDELNRTNSLEQTLSENSDISSSVANIQDKPTKHSEPSKTKGRVSWTPSIMQHSPARELDDEKTEQLEEPSPDNNQCRRTSRVIQMIPEEFMSYGLGRVGHRMSIVK